MVIIAQYATNSALNLDINTRRPLSSLAEYAAMQGGEACDFTAFGWSDTLTLKRDGLGKYRPAIKFHTPGGWRWRFMDGAPGQKYTSEKGFKLCWYGLDSALKIAQATGQPILIVNGEATVIIAQKHGLAAVCVSGAGEQNHIPVDRLAELQAAGVTHVIVAYDCDDTGRTNAPYLAVQLRAAGMDAHAIDLGLGDKGDVANFCKLNRTDSVRLITECSILPDPAPEPERPRRERVLSITPGTTNWEHERRLWWVEVLDALDRSITRRTRTHFQCLNPRHPDGHPSARISTDKDPDGLYVCTCGVKKRSEVAEWLNFPAFMDWWKENRRPQNSARVDNLLPMGNTPEMTTKVVTPYFDTGAPDTWIAAANLVGINIAVLHLLYASAAKRQTNQLTTDDLKTDNLALGYGIEPRRIYETLHLLVDHTVRFLPVESVGLPGKKRTDRITLELLPHAQVEQYLSACLAVKLNMTYHPTEGERAAIPLFTSRMMDAPTISETAETASALNAAAADLSDDLAEETLNANYRRDLEMRYWDKALKDHTHTPLTADMPKHNAAALTRARADLLIPTGVITPQYEIARILGTSVRSARTVLKERGFKGKAPNIQPQQVGSMMEAKTFARAHRAKIWQFTSYTPNEAPTRHYYRSNEEAEAFIQAERSRGACVFADIKPPLIYERVVQVVEAETPAEPRERISPPRQPAAPDQKQTETAPTFAPHEYDPAWVTAQLRLLLTLLQPKRWQWTVEGDLVDTDGGEVHDQPTAHTLIALILGREIYQNLPKPTESSDFTRWPRGAPAGYRLVKEAV